MTTGDRDLRTGRHGDARDARTGMRLPHETPLTCADLDHSFNCHHCQTWHLLCDRVDVSSVTAIGRERYACTTCAAAMFDADDEDRATRVMVLRDVAKMAEQNWIAEDV